MRFDRSKFFAGVRDFLKSDGKTLTQDRTGALEFLLTRFEDAKWSIPEISYALATVYHETAHTFEPIYEMGPRSYFNKYEPGTRIGKKLGNTEVGDGYRYRGAGYVQITGRANYEKFGMENEPERATDPHYAFLVLADGMRRGRFTGKKLSDYISDTGKDYKNARKIINGTDKAQLIAGYANRFEEILRASKVSAAVLQQSAPIPDKEGDAHIPSDQPPTNSETKVEVSAAGAVSVEKSEGTPGPRERIAVVKSQPAKWSSRVTTKITGVVTGNALFQWIWGQAEKIQGMEIHNAVWVIVSITIAVGSLLWIVHEIVDTWRANRNQERIDDLLVKENSTSENLVQLIPADELELYRARGFKIITRGEKV